MTSFTVPGGNASAILNYTAPDAATYAQALAGTIGAKLAAGTLVNVNYISGPTAPGGTATTPDAVTFTAATTTPVAVPITDAAIIDAASGPVSITGGAPGASVVAGSGGLSYTGITPTGTGMTTTIVAGDGANQISTSMSGGGNYLINTGSGNDTIGIFTGNGTVNAGTGFNTIVLGGGTPSGNSFVYSEGFDSIVGNTVPGGGGTDTVNIGSGQTTINPGSSNFFVFGSSPSNSNPLSFLIGTGSSTVAAGLGASTIAGGLGGNNLLIAGLSPAGSTITGGGSGDNIFAVGAGAVSATAGAGNETISGAGGTTPLLANYTAPGSTANNTFIAGSGNDSLLAGAGMDTLQGAGGTAMLKSGTGADTFLFKSGASGGSDTISGFKSTDTLQLTGYGLTATTVSTMISAGGGTITLSDNTKVTLAGVTSVSATQIKSS